MLHLGLDIGASTVGFAVVDVDNKKIIDSGTSVFSKADPENNKMRRYSRGARRRSNRKSHRVKRVDNLLKRNGFVENNEACFRNPYEVKVFALNHEISDAELVYILKHYVKHRGIDYLSEEEIKEVSKSGVVYDTGAEDKRFISEKELERFNKFLDAEKNGGVLHDFFDIGIRNGAVVYSKFDYKREIEQILNTQSKFNSKITKEFISEYVDIFMSKRKYYEGPGTKKDRTDYGIYRENGETWNNITKNLVGRCSIYGDCENLTDDEKRRAPKMSYTAQEFNILNDLNNLRLGEDERKLTKTEKLEIIDIILNSKVVKIKDIITKVSGEPKDTIKGFRIDKDGKELFHKFEAYRILNKALKDKFNLDNLTKNEMNIFANELSLDGEDIHFKEELRNNSFLDKNKFTEEVIDFILFTVKKISAKEVIGWHSLSYKAMEEIMDDLYETSKNQQQLFVEKGMFEFKLQKYKDKNKIPVDDVLEDILSPVAKRAFNQAIQIINEAVKKHGQMDGIVIEMARDIYKSDGELKNEQRDREKENKKIKEEIETYCKSHGLKFDSKAINSKNIEKVKLWKSQNEMCLYSLKKITYEALIYDICGINGGILEVDHIIPRSISFDNSLDNKVLVYRRENQSKGKRTPYQYIPNDNWSGYEDVITELHKTNKISKKKKDLLLTKEDITKIDVLAGFINRNLVDTSYACRSVLNVIKNYMKANHIQTKVYSVKGGFTSMVRNTLRLKKDRNLYKNHAEDAVLVAYIPKLNIMAEYRELKRIFVNGNANTTVGKGRLLDDSKFIESIVDSDLIKIKNEIENYHFKYRHKVDKKPNRQLTDATIVKTRGIDGNLYIIRKYSNIYGSDGEKLAAIIRKDKIEDFEKLLIYKEDIKSFNILKDIANQYPNEKNPFSKYKNEFGLIRKYSKKGNGPFIKNIAYAEKKLGNCLDISHKYGLPKNSKRVILISVKNFRVDIYLKNGKYRAVDISYGMFKFENDNYVLDMKKYIDKKIEKGIDDDWEFKFSIYTNDVVLLSDKCGERKLRYVSIDVSDGRLCFRLTDSVTTGVGEGGNKQIRVSIGSKDVKFIKKINYDRLGNGYITEKEKFKTEFDFLN